MGPVTSSERFARRLPVALVAGVLVLVISARCSEAKTKRLDKRTLKAAVALGKDREAAFAGEEAMPAEEFKERWTAFASQLNEAYGGHEVRLKKFGVDVGYRKGFTHLLYMALKVQTRGTLLSPPVQELVSEHTFLQELSLQGSCYTGGDAFPKKMRDLLEAQEAMQYLLREHLDKWEGKHRKQFEKVFPRAQ